MLLALRSLFETPRISASIQGVTSSFLTGTTRAATSKVLSKVSSHGSSVSLKAKSALSIKNTHVVLNIGSLVGGQPLSGIVLSSATSQVSSSRSLSANPSSIFGSVFSVDISGRESHLSFVSSHLTVSKPSVHLFNTLSLVTVDINTATIFPWSISKDTISLDITVKDTPTKATLTNRHNTAFVSVVDKKETVSISSKTNILDAVVKDQSEITLLSKEFSSIEVLVLDKDTSISLSSIPNTQVLLSDNTNTINITAKPIAKPVLITNKPSFSDIITSNKN